MNELPSPLPAQGFSVRALAKALAAAELPEEYVRSLPAQSLHMALRHLGVSACADIVQITGSEQRRLLLDLDLWHKDSFNEENFWEWLALGDEENGLMVLQKILQAVDLKLVGLIVARHVRAVVFDEPTETPPAAHFYTPDKGYTWLSVEIEDNKKVMLLGRFLALIFETDPGLFYQIISIPPNTTESTLEEESYQEKNKRLAAEGIPLPEHAAELNSAMPLSQLPSAAAGKQAHICDVNCVEPLVYEPGKIQPLSDLLAQAPRAELEAELSLIMNAALVHWGVDLSNLEEVLFFVRKVRGAINLGLELCAEQAGLTPQQSLERLGLQKLYRLGLGELFKLRREAQKIMKAKRPGDLAVSDLALLEAISIGLPSMPAFLDVKGSLITQNDGKLAAGNKEIINLTETKMLAQKLAELAGPPLGQA